MPSEDIAAAAMMALVALTPVVFALASWQPGAARDGFAALSLFYSLPVTAIEIVVILHASRSGFNIGSVLDAQPKWAGWTLALLIAIAVLTAIAAPEPSRAMLRTAQSLVHLLSALAICDLLWGRWAQLRDGLWTWIAAGCCLYVAIVAAWVARVMADPAFDWTVFSLAVTNVRQLGFYSAVGACAALGLAATASKTSRYTAAVAAASVMVGLSCWSGTRSSFLAIAAAYVVAAFVFPDLRRRRALQALGLSFLFGMLLSVMVFMPADPAYGLHRMLLASGGGEAEITSGRLEMWQAALRAIMDRPLFGYGEGQFGIVVPEANGYNHPHNIILQVALHWGLVGLTCFVALGGLILRRFVAAAQGNSDALPPVLVVASLLAMSLIEGSFYHPYPVMMIGLAVAFVLAGPRERGGIAARRG